MHAWSWALFHGWISCDDGDRESWEVIAGLHLSLAEALALGGEPAEAIRHLAMILWGELAEWAPPDVVLEARDRHKQALSEIALLSR